MWAAMLLWLFASGCGRASFDPIGDAADAGDGIDARWQDAIDCASWNPPSGHVAPCTVPGGAAWTIPTSATYDTGTGLVEPGGAMPTSYVVGGMRVVSVASFTVGSGATLRVVGVMPLLILSWSDITVNGTIDVSSNRVGTSLDLGAGANGSTCGATDGGGGTDCGGGGGGAYRGNGGSGGDGLSAPGGVGGNSIAEPTAVVGGCAGGNGGTGVSRGDGGAGGGAIQLTARIQILIGGSGRLHAGGAGGAGGTGDGAGGGGGSGGFIGLDAVSVQLAAGAILASNGGGGGTGCDTGNGPQGENGRLDATQAAGGLAAVCSGATFGGTGGASAMHNGSAGQTDTGQNAGSGGGGGGGGGHIVSWGTLTDNATVSPMIIAH